MPAPLGLDARIAAMKAVPGAGLTWARRVWELMDYAFSETRNPFGSVALATTGSSAGDIPLLDAAGRYPSALTPNRGTGEVTGNLTTPSSLATLRASPQVDQLPSIPGSKFNAGVFHFSAVPPFDASRISGQLALARLPGPGEAAITRQTVTTVFNVTRAGGGVGTIGRLGTAEITSQTFAGTITTAGSNVTLALTYTFNGRVTRGGRSDTGS